jgi:hypothetical protein
VLQRNSEEARMAMEAVFEGPLTFTPVDTPDGKRFRIQGQASVGKMLVTEPPEVPPTPRVSKSASPAGFEPSVTLASARNQRVDPVPTPWIIQVELFA